MTIVNKLLLSGWPASMRGLTPVELGLIAEGALARGLDRAQLVVAKPCTGRRRMRVLGGTKGIKTLWGEVCCENADGHTVVWVDAVDLLAWLAAYAGVRVELGGSR